jgi:hypothetical protein
MTIDISSKVMNMSLEVNDSMFWGNSATEGGGALYVSGMETDLIGKHSNIAGHDPRKMYHRTQETAFAVTP